MKKYRIECRKILIEEYQQLRKTTNWNSVEDKAVEKALGRDLFSICVFDEDKIIGMGRVIGDGAIYFYIQDIIVLPEYQGKGIGNLIMNNIETFINKNDYNNSFVGLMAAKGTIGFYDNFGYLKRPENKPGMYKIIKKNDSINGIKS